MKSDDFLPFLSGRVWVLVWLGLWLILPSTFVVVLPSKQARKKPPTRRESSSFPPSLSPPPPLIPQKLDHVTTACD